MMGQCSVRGLLFMKWYWGTHDRNPNDPVNVWLCFLDFIFLSILFPFFATNHLWLTSEVKATHVHITKYTPAHQNPSFLGISPHCSPSHWEHPDEELQHRLVGHDNTACGLTIMIIIWLPTGVYVNSCFPFFKSTHFLLLGEEKHDFQYDTLYKSCLLYCLLYLMPLPHLLLL